MITLTLESLSNFMLVYSHSGNHISQPNKKSNLQQIGLQQRVSFTMIISSVFYASVTTRSYTYSKKWPDTVERKVFSNSIHLTEMGIHILKWKQLMSSPKIWLHFDRNETVWAQIFNANKGQLGYGNILHYLNKLLHGLGWNPGDRIWKSHSSLV